MRLPIPATDRPKVPGVLRFYSITAYITGIMLLLLCAEMILKYIPWDGQYGYELFAGSNYGALAFVSNAPDNGATGINLSTGILIAHGWLYVVYLIGDFRLWSIMRWPFVKFIEIALGGVIPFMSFIVEARIRKQVLATLAEYDDATVQSQEVAQ